MAAQQSKRTSAEDQAAGWLARLGTRSVSLDTVKEFTEWRENPKNDETYRRMERLWSEAGGLADDADICAGLQSALSRKPRRREQRLRFAAVIVAAAASLAAGVFFWQGHGVYQTGVGEQRVVQLADGSTVRLDTRSKVRVRLSSGERHVDLLDGQALFEVAHDAFRPFVVATDDARVIAVGTVFEVRRSAAATRVVLVSGAVDVVQTKRGQPSRQRLKPDQQADIKGNDARLTAVDAEAATSWTEGKLTFVDTPLIEAISEVNRYLAEPIILEAPAIEHTAVNGVFRSGDRAAFVSATAQLLNLRMITEPDGRVRLIGPQKNIEGG